MNKNDIIKIAFNWIGPRGPIPNTEVPNLLNLAAVSEATATDSQKFWCDSIWHLIFCNQPGYDISPITFLNDRDLFIYSMPLWWRIPFTNYFYGDSGIFEYSHTPSGVLSHIRGGNGFLLLEQSAEAYVTGPELTALHAYLELNRIPPNKVIYLTGCMNATTLYEYWCIEKGYTNKMHMIPFPVSQDSLAIYFTTWNPSVPEYDAERVPEKLFLAWNRRFRQHRTAIALGLNKLNLLDRSYVSMHLMDPENNRDHITNTYYDYLLKDFDIQPSDITNFVNKLPLTLDGETDVDQMCQDFNDATRPFYQNSLVSIITETNFNAQEVTLTEKSFKPMKEKHPFISVGAAGTLKALRDMGFKTFSDFWDESYDDVSDPRERIRRILNVCNKISKWDNETIINFRRNVKPILDNNYERLKVRYSTDVADKIRQIVMNGRKPDRV
jgi:hypothetical protein